MKLFCAITFLTVLSLVTTATENDSDDYVPYEGQRYDTFDWQLLKVLKTSDQGNYIISPLGVKILLAMLYEGAAGLTEKELQSVLQFPISRQATRDRFHQIINKLHSSEGNYMLNMGSKLFLDSTLTLQQRFAAVLQLFYNSTVELVQFDHIDETKYKINNWAQNITNGYVHDLVDDEILKQAILLLANAIYFKGFWRTPFPRNNTANDMFYMSANQVVTVPFMSNFEQYFYSEAKELDANVLRLPYKGNHISMFIILPNKNTGLQNVIEKINPQILKRIQWTMDKRNIHIHIPKFAFQFNAHLEQPLQTIGLHHIFKNTASLPGIARVENSSKEFLVSDIVQKAGIELNEEGSTVWAATDVALGNKFGTPELVFNATHPFLFFIEDELTGTVLFIGKVGNPNQKESVNMNI